MITLIPIYGSFGWFNVYQVWFDNKLEGTFILKSEAEALERELKEKLKCA